MEFVKRYKSRILLCAVLIVMVVIVCLVAINTSNSASEVSETEAYIAEYRRVIEPAMLSDSVSTTFTVEDNQSKASLRYAISGINSLVSYSSETDGNVYLVEIWNNTEKYFLRTVVDNEEHVYSVNVTEGTREELNSYVYSYYIMAMSYLGVAAKERVVMFEQESENVYYAQSVIEDTTYDMRFTLEDGVLTNIRMFEDMYEDRSVDIRFDKYNVSEQSYYELTEDSCEVSYIGEMLSYDY